MTGYTASEIAAETGVKIKTVKKRLGYAKVKPLTKEALYDIDALEIVRNFRGPGRPKTKDSSLD